MKEIKICDITMKCIGKANGLTLSFREKIEISKLLDRLGVSVIELHGIENPKIDSLLVKSVATAVKSSIVALPVGLSESGAARAWNALKEAAKPRLQVCAPTSPVQMEYLAHKKPVAMLEAIAETVVACRQLCQDVEFIAEDATRSDPAFLAEAINAAIDAGAGTVTLCDTAGAMMPDEFTAFLKTVYDHAPAVSRIALGVSCANDLAMADSCAIAAVQNGAAEIKAAVYGVGTASLENIARILAAKGHSYDAGCGVKMTEMKRIIEQITWMCETNRSKNCPFDNPLQPSEALSLSEKDDLPTVLKAVDRLGYELSEEDGAKVYEAFCRIAARKESVGAKELDAIVAAAAMQVPPTYRLETYVINSGNVISATAHVRLRKQEQSIEGISLGDGPIDASFLAIEHITGHHYELDDFQIIAVTEGREAMGETVIKLRSGGKLYSGRGISTDIIGASILAYVNALNKIVYEEAEA